MHVQYQFKIKEPLKLKIHGEKALEIQDIFGCRKAH